MDKNIFISKLTQDRQSTTKGPANKEPAKVEDKPKAFAKGKEQEIGFEVQGRFCLCDTYGWNPACGVDCQNKQSDVKHLKAERAEDGCDYVLLEYGTINRRGGGGHVM